MKKYEKPELMIVEFKAEDNIMLSGMLDALEFEMLEIESDGVKMSSFSNIDF